MKRHILLFLSLLLVGSTFAQYPNESRFDREQREQRERLNRQLDEKKQRARARALEEQAYAAEVAAADAQATADAALAAARQRQTVIVQQAPAQIPPGSVVREGIVITPEMQAHWSELARQAREEQAAQAASPDFSVTQISDGRYLLVIRGRPTTVRTKAEVLSFLEHAIVVVNAQPAQPAP